MSSERQERRVQLQDARKELSAGWIVGARDVATQTLTLWPEMTMWHVAVYVTTLHPTSPPLRRLCGASFQRRLTDDKLPAQSDDEVGMEGSRSTADARDRQWKLLGLSQRRVVM
jgi:hypothetical protein